MMYLQSVRSEGLKIKGSSLFWLAIGGSFVLPIIFLIRDLLLGGSINHIKHFESDWIPIYDQLMTAFTGFIMPMAIILVSSLITQLEYRNNNWKQLHTTPQSYTSIFFAKYTLLIGLILMVYVLLNIGVIIMGLIPCLVFDKRLPDDSIPWYYFFKQSMISFFTCLPIIAIQYMISLRFRNFLIPIAIGFVFIMCSMLALKFEHSYFFPYTYPLFYFDHKFSFSNPIMPELVIFYFVLFSIINYVMYRFRVDKS